MKNQNLSKSVPAITIGRTDLTAKMEDKITSTFNTDNNNTS